MATRNTPGKTTGKTKAAAAQAETNGKPAPKQLEWRGLTLDLPDELPKTFLWDLSAAQGNIAAWFDLAQSLLKQEQLPLVRAALQEADELPGDFVMELAGAMFAQYGVDVGESSASQDS